MSHCIDLQIESGTVPLVLDGAEAKMMITSRWINSCDDSTLLRLLRWFARYEQDLTSIECVREFDRIRYFERVRQIAASDDELAALAQGALKESGPKRVRPPTVKKPKGGYVYIIGSAEYGLYKIGRTNKEVDERLYQFSPMLPFPCCLVTAIKTKSPAKLERSLHKVLEDKRVNGEWFALTEEDIERIKEGTRDGQILV